MSEDTKRGRGRPATGETPKRTVRVPDDEWAMVREAADAEGESASDYIRRVVLRDAKRVLKTRHDDA